MNYINNFINKFSLNKKYKMNIIILQDKLQTRLLNPVFSNLPFDELVDDEGKAKNFARSSGWLAKPPSLPWFFHLRE